MIKLSLDQYNEDSRDDMRRLCAHYFYRVEFNKLIVHSFLLIWFALNIWRYLNVFFFKFSFYSWLGKVMDKKVFNKRELNIAIADVYLVTLPRYCHLLMN